MELNLTMKKFLLTVVFCLFAPSAWAQCNGIFPANTLCGNLSGSPQPPAAFSAAGTVVGPSSSTSGNVVVWGNNSGTLLSNSNYASSFIVNSSLTSIFTVNLTGGMQFGNDWAVGTNNYYPLGNIGTNFNLQQATFFNSDQTNSPNAVTVASRDKTATPGATALGLTSFCFAENASSNGCWSIYTEGHRINGSDNVFAAGEFAAVNRSNAFLGDSNPYLGPGPFNVMGYVGDCGNSQPTSFYTEYSCTNAIYIQSNFDSSQGGPNSKGFLHGITFNTNSFDTSAAALPSDAIGLATSPTQAVGWWTNSSSRAWVIYSDTTAGNTPQSPQAIILHSSNAQFTTHVHGGGGTPAQGNSACAGFSLQPTAGDTDGKVTFNSALSCQIAFSTAWANAPSCTVTPGGVSPSTLVATTTTSILIATFGTSQTAMSWHCFGQ